MTLSRISKTTPFLKCKYTSHHFCVTSSKNQPVDIILISPALLDREITVKNTNKCTLGDIFKVERGQNKWWLECDDEELTHRLVFFTAAGTSPASTRPRTTRSESPAQCESFHSEMAQSLIMSDYYLLIWISVGASDQSESHNDSRVVLTVEMG